MKRLSAFFLFVFSLALLAQKADDPWSKATKLFPDILYLKLEKTEPRLEKMHLIRVNVGNRRYGFVTTPRPKEWNEKMPGDNKWKVVTRIQNTYEFLLEMRKKKYDVVLAVNASPWSPFPAKPKNNPFAANMGLVISNGQVLDTNDLGRPSFVVLKNGGLDFRTPSKAIPVENIYISLPGFSVILEKGEVTAGAASDTSVHPRTGYGLSRDRRYFYILVVDGRQNGYSVGQSTGEMAKIFKEYGAYDALNMDGGGSTTLVKWSKDKKSNAPEVVNKPCGGAYLRKNGNNLGIYKK